MYNPYATNTFYFTLDKLKQITPVQLTLVVFFTRLFLLAALLSVLFPVLVFTLLLFTFPWFLFFRAGEEVERETEEDWKAGTATDQHGILLQVIHTELDQVVTEMSVNVNYAELRDGIRKLSNASMLTMDFLAGESSLLVSFCRIHS